MAAFAQICPGTENWDQGVQVARHRHDCGYAAVVLAGGYEECGSRGRFRADPGSVLLHGAFDAHLDRFATKPTLILNLTLGACEFPHASAGRVKDLDRVARMAERDPRSAAIELHAQLTPTMPEIFDWPDMLASALLLDGRVQLGEWARNHGLAPETVSRGFRKVFGIGPAAFRAEVRAQAALGRIVRGHSSLAAIAAAAGFADQAHMSRATRELTGRSPAQWRTSISFKTADSRAA